MQVLPPTVFFRLCQSLFIGCFFFARKQNCTSKSGTGDQKQQDGKKHIAAVTGLRSIDRNGRGTAGGGGRRLFRFGSCVVRIGIFKHHLLRRLLGRHVVFAVFTGPALCGEENKAVACLGCIVVEMVLLL